MDIMWIKLVGTGKRNSALRDSRIWRKKWLGFVNPVQAPYLLSFDLQSLTKLLERTHNDFPSRPSPPPPFNVAVYSITKTPHTVVSGQWNVPH